MVSGKYSALTGAIAREQSLSNISSNLANVTTAGYKKTTLSFEAILRGEKQIQDSKGINYNRIAKSHVDFTQGPLKQTDNPFHFALVGDGFFKIRGNEEDHLTRNGTFVLNENGNLVTDTGSPVLDVGGNEIAIPEALISRVVADEQGRLFTVDAEGNRAEVAQLAIVDVEDRTALVRKNNTSFSVPINVIENVPENYAVNQGALEISNVNMTLEMTHMIRENRLYETYHNTLKSYSKLGEKLSDLGTLG